jgi:hypothetical protein
MVQSTIGNPTSNLSYSKHRLKGRGLCIGNAVSMHDESIYKIDEAPAQGKMSTTVSESAAASLHSFSIGLMILKGA